MQTPPKSLRTPPPGPDVKKKPSSRRPKEVRWNTDPEWLRFLETYERSVLPQMAMKVCSGDADLREDCKQVARIALHQIFSESIGGPETKRGTIPEEEWWAQADRYCRNAIRYSMLTFLASPTQGNWSSGRVARIPDPKTGKRKRVRLPGALFSSLDGLIEEFGLQVTDQGEISWDVVRQDGVDASLWSEDEEG